MDKAEFNRVMAECGDAIIHYINTVGKVKYLTATTDFTTPVIAEKGIPDQEIEGSILVFSWDNFKFKFVPVDRVTKIIPLSAEIYKDVPSKRNL